jgi:excisionase family DNA binding protein
MTSQINPTIRDAKVASSMVSALADEKASGPVFLVIGKQKVELSKNLVSLVEQMALSVKARETVTFISGTELMTTQQAADYLGYSRPTLIMLLDKFSVPFSRVGRHRKIKFEDVENLKMAIREDQETFLREMSQLEQQLGIDD